MHANQTSVSWFDTENDALADMTYRDQKGLILTGSSLCRQKTSISKVEIGGDFSNEVAEKNAKKAEYDEHRKLTVEPLSAKDMPQFNNVERSKPLEGYGKDKVKSMSRRTKTKIRQKMLAWTRTPRQHRDFKFAFITLTLTSKQIGDSREYNKLLNTFMTWMRKYYPVKNYLWVNEVQTKTTGNLHTHIVSDLPFLPLRKLNNEWCKILKSAGYSADHQGGAWQYADKQIWGYNKWGTYVLIYDVGDCMSNPLSISQVKDERKVANYVTKYVSKNETAMEGMLWNCSNSISRLFTGCFFWDKSTASVLLEHVRHSYEVKLTDGHKMHIHLFQRWSPTLAGWFKINHSVMDGTLDRDKYIKSLKAI